MRTILAVLIVILAVAPVAAFDYANARFGYAIRIPDGFSGRGEADNGDGQAFVSADGTTKLRVYGGNNMQPDFELLAGYQAEFFDGQGWDIGYQRTTPSWASFSGERNRQILYVRIIALCGGTQYATFELTYPRTALEAMNAVVERLVGSLRSTGSGASC